MLSWDELEKACSKCKKCELHKTRTNVVLGVGNRTAEILFIGEGPGEQEDLRGEPFVGRAGALLDDMLKIINLNRDKNIYIANIVKCRPPGNRDPHNTEREACIDWLRAQYELIKPKIVVCLGRVAATEIIDREMKISRDHGKWYYKYFNNDNNDLEANYENDSSDKVKMMAIFHPAALLRDPHKKPDTFIDLKELEKEIKSICTRTL